MKSFFTIDNKLNYLGEGGGCWNRFKNEWNKCFEIEWNNWMKLYLQLSNII